MSRIMERRKKIETYIGLYERSPLSFLRYAVGEGVAVPMESDGSDLDVLVMEILEKAMVCMSYNGVRIETMSGRMRSSLDIWRHAKFVSPDVDILSIMESIHRLRDRIYGHYCTTVKRSVFRLPNNYGIALGRRSFYCREYRIRFSTWGKLHE